MDASGPKVSATEPIKFRPGIMGKPIADLMALLAEKQPDVELSATLRDALEAFWPQIVAYLLTRQTANISTQQLVVMTGICAKALANGATVAEIEALLADLMEAKLTVG